MIARGKQVFAPDAYGADLRRRRHALGLRLVDVASKTSIDVGQLSRFECGDFKYRSANLQAYAQYLLRIEGRKPRMADDDLSMRAQRLAQHSPQLKAAVVAILSALEALA